MSTFTHNYNHMEGLTESLVCTLEYTAAEPMTLEYPGAPERIELVCVTLLGHDITKAISDELEEEIEQSALDSYSDGPGEPD